MVELLSDTPEWADVEPLALPEGTHSAVDIQYTADYKDTFGLLHACMQTGEMSERVLKLTEKCVILCPSHYTAWYYRFQVCYFLHGWQVNFQIMLQFLNPIA
jgi:hypothetical protein